MPLRYARAAGYSVKLIFLSLATPDEAIARVRRRFATGLRNFLDLYRRRVDYWQWFDNSGPLPRLLEEGTNR